MSLETSFNALPEVTKKEVRRLMANLQECHRLTASGSPRNVKAESRKRYRIRRRLTALYPDWNHVEFTCERLPDGSIRASL
jgi:hypothetical protein